MATGATALATQGYKPPLTVRCKPPVQGRTKWVYFAGNLGTREGDTQRCAASLSSLSLFLPQSTHVGRSSGLGLGPGLRFGLGVRPKPDPNPNHTVTLAQP